MNPRLPPPPLLRELLLRLLELLRLELDRLLELLRDDPPLKRVALLPDDVRTALVMASMVDPPLLPVAAVRVRLKLRLARLRLAPIWRDLPLNDPSAGRLLSDADEPAALAPSPIGAGCQDNVGANTDPLSGAAPPLVTITGRVHGGICACKRSASRSTTSCTSSATA